MKTLFLVLFFSTAAAHAETALFENPHYSDREEPEPFKISARSSSTGVCRYLGFHRPKEVTLTPSDEDRTAVIDEKGELDSYYGNAKPELNKVIQSIVCERIKKPSKKKGRELLFQKPSA